MLFIYIPHTHAAEFDIILNENISDKGIYNGKNGIIYASMCENNSMLAIIHIENSSLTADIYGSENEAVDSLTVKCNGKKNCRVSISGRNEPLCITVTENKKDKYYRLINDSFTATNIKPVKSTPLFRYTNKKARVEADTSGVIKAKNALTYERAEKIPLREVILTNSEKSDILLLLKACADIYTFNPTDYDIDYLTLHVLYTHKNFALLSKIPTQSSENTTIKMCSEPFIADVMYKAFRITPKKPALNMLTETGYCYNNGLYYYRGGYKNYFATDIKEIIKSYAIADNSIYVIFKNTYTDSSTPVSEEYSSATLKKDKDGYYLTSLYMGKLIDNPQTITSPDTIEKAPLLYKRYIPVFIILIASAVIGIVIYFYIL